MKASYKFENPADVECTLTVTMKVHDWELLLAHIGNDWPGWELRRAVRSLIANARKELYAPKVEVPD